MDVPPCNPVAPEEYPRFVLLLGLMSLGTNLAGAAADALLVEYAQTETESTRGSIQSKMMTVQMVGKFVSIILAAFGFNGKLYTGSFDQRKQLSFMQYCQVLLPLDFSVRRHLRASFHLLCSKGFFLYRYVYLLEYQYLRG